jgi:hypothetical protein
MSRMKFSLRGDITPAARVKAAYVTAQLSTFNDAMGYLQILTDNCICFSEPFWADVRQTVSETKAENAYLSLSLYIYI